METALTLIIVAIAGIGVALAYTIAGPKIRQRYHNDTLRTRSAWAFPTFWFNISIKNSLMTHQRLACFYAWQKIRGLCPVELLLLLCWSVRCLSLQHVVVEVCDRSSLSRLFFGSAAYMARKLCSCVVAWSSLISYEPFKSEKISVPSDGPVVRRRTIATVISVWSAMTDTLPLKYLLLCQLLGLFGLVVYWSNQRNR